MVDFLYAKLSTEIQRCVVETKSEVVIYSNVNTLVHQVVNSFVLRQFCRICDTDTQAFTLAMYRNAYSIQYHTEISEE